LELLVEGWDESKSPLMEVNIQGFVFSSRQGLAPGLDNLPHSDLGLGVQSLVITPK